MPLLWCFSTPVLHRLCRSRRALLGALQVLNFSIAYGKTAHGLSRDWGTSQQDAQATVDRWYSDRPEVSPPTLALQECLKPVVQSSEKEEPNCLTCRCLCIVCTTWPC